MAGLKSPRSSPCGPAVKGKDGSRNNPAHKDQSCPSETWAPGGPSTRSSWGAHTLLRRAADRTNEEVWSGPAGNMALCRDPNQKISGTGVEIEEEESSARLREGKCQQPQVNKLSGASLDPFPSSCVIPPGLQRGPL